MAWGAMPVLTNSNVVKKETNLFIWWTYEMASKRNNGGAASRDANGVRRVSKWQTISGIAVLGIAAAS